MNKRRPGRPKNVENKINMFRLPTILETLEKEDVRPLEILARECKGAEASDRIRAAEALCKYIYPTVRTIEVKADVQAKVESGQGQAIIDQLFEIISHMAMADGSKK